MASKLEAKASLRQWKLFKVSTVLWPLTETLQILSITASSEQMSKIGLLTTISMFRSESSFKHERIFTFILAWRSDTYLYECLLNPS